MGGNAGVPLREGAVCPVPAHTFSGAILIMGGAACLWNDLKALGDWPHDRMAVNDIGSHWHHPLRHWATLHPDYLPGWMHYRMGHNYGSGGHVFTHTILGRNGDQHVQHKWPILDIGGSSGLFAVFIALLMGYERVVLAGMPIDGTPHYFDPPWATGAALDGGAEEIVWCEQRDRTFAGRVTSLSGRTRQWLGAPA